MEILMMKIEEKKSLHCRPNTLQQTESRLGLLMVRSPIDVAWLFHRRARVRGGPFKKKKKKNKKTEALAINFF
jgi:hypothetical protein